MPAEMGFDAVIGRLKSALGLPSDAAVARELGLKSTSFSDRRKRGSLPYSEILDVATRMGLDVAWLLTGNRSIGAIEVREPAAGLTQEIDTDLLAAVLSAMRKELTARGVSLSPEREAKVAALLYAHFSLRGRADSEGFSRFLDVVLGR